MSAELPDTDRLAWPLKVVSIQLNEPGYGATGRVGQVVFDDLQAVLGDTGEEVLLEGFESPLDWFTLPTTSVGADDLVRTMTDVRSGLYAALFSFGKETNMGIRGFYRSARQRIQFRRSRARRWWRRRGYPRGSELLIRLAGGIVPSSNHRRRRVLPYT